VEKRKKSKVTKKKVIEEKKKRVRRSPETIEEDITNHLAKIARYHVRIQKLQSHITHLKELKVKAIHREQLKENTVILKVTKVERPNEFGEFQITTSEGLKFTSLKKLKLGTTYKVSKSFYKKLKMTRTYKEINGEETK